jgi:cytochrome oxidase Cu insertion factor (SCO1/SenC/PrrC family)
MTAKPTGRPGPALITLGVIVVITAAWWALALWPAGAAPPEWLVRTRAACFGAAPGGLPDAGGWILLIGDPAGIAAVFIALWRRSLQSELARLGRDPLWRVVASGVVVAALTVFGVLGVRVSRAYASPRPDKRFAGAVRRSLDMEPPAIPLVDQHGQHVSLADLRGQPVLLTFAFGHCTTVCPTIVNDLLAARRASRRGDVRLIVLTLDPWRDTPDRLPYLASHWELAPGDRVMSGSVSAVDSTLDALGITRGRNEANGTIEHTSTVMLLTERGRLAWRLDGWWGSADLLLR